LSKIREQRFSLYRELHFNHNIDMTMPHGGHGVNFMDMARVVRRALASDLDNV
jgi:hypothetical protein